MKKLIFVSCLCSVLLLSGCGAQYEIKPTGTNDTTEIGYFEVPVEYTTESMTTETEVKETTLEDMQNSAIARKTAFEALLDSADLYIDMQRVRTYGESVESAQLVCGYTANDDVYYAAYNAAGEQLQEVYGNGDTVYLLDHIEKKRMETTRDTYRFCNRAVLKNSCVFKDVKYIKTYDDTINDRALVCDEYTMDDTVVRYYYDTAGNLIVLRVTTVEDDVNTLFNELKTYVETDLWTKYADYEIVQLID